MASSAGRVLIYGGKGALGSICVNFFKGKNYLFPLDSITVYVTQSVWRKVQDLGLVVAYREDNGTHTFIRKLLALPFLPSKHIEAAFRKLQDTANTPAKWVGSIDVSTNESADANILVNVEASWVDQEKHVVDQVGKLTEDGKLDAVLCVAGGWAGGNAASDEFITNADKMWKQSVWPSTIAAAVAAKYLKDGGIISLPGAMPALKGTPGMIGYGIAKAAVHQLTQSLASKKGGLPQNSLAVALLPVTLDTPMNRKFMPNADFSSWTKLEFIAELLHGWVNGENRPENGSLMKIVTKDNKTEVTPADK